jgi:hypothetical protein
MTNKVSQHPTTATDSSSHSSTQHTKLASGVTNRVEDTSTHISTHQSVTSSTAPESAAPTCPLYLTYCPPPVLTKLPYEAKTTDWSERPSLQDEAYDFCFDISQSRNHCGTCGNVVSSPTFPYHLYVPVVSLILEIYLLLTLDSVLKNLGA